MFNRKLNVLLSMVCVSLPSVAAEKTLFSFDWLSPFNAAQTGSNPNGTLLRDSSGALYGTNMVGGRYYNGTVFKLSPPVPGQTDWTLSILYTFTGGSDGGLPNPDLVMDSSGALYGTTSGGGSWTDEGLVYKLTPPQQAGAQWSLTVIHYFESNFLAPTGDGSNPATGLVMDKTGALYGTTDLGGDISDPSGIGAGTVFKLTPTDAAKTKWDETILYRFKGGTDGANPMTALILDEAGALYGTTLYGGTGGCVDLLSSPLGCGTVFQLSPPAPGNSAWNKTTLHQFGGGQSDGAMPQARLMLGASGSLYGTTFQGGSGGCTDMLLTVIGCGTVFELKPPATAQKGWTETILHTFTGPDGAFPQGGVVTDESGALFGATSGGGPSSYGVGGFGVLYKLTPPGFGQTLWAHTDVYDFDIRDSGTEAIGELVRDPQGHFFGVTYSGGANYGGTVYEIAP